MNQDVQKLTLTIEIEPLALDILTHQANWQGLTLDQIAAYYIGRCAGMIEEKHGNALIADVFNGLVERNKPIQQRRKEEQAQNSGHVHRI